MVVKATGRLASAGHESEEDVYVAPTRFPEGPARHQGPMSEGRI